METGVYFLNSSDPEFSEIKKKFKLGNKLPQMRFYKPNLFGEKKNNQSFEIHL